MKIRVFLIIIVLTVFTHGTVFAQEKNADIEYNKLFEQVNAYIEKENFAATIPLLNRMQKLKPGELIPVEYLGIFYTNIPEEKPEFTNALFWLIEAEKRASSNASVYYNLACVYSQKRDVKKAEVAMNKAVALGFDDFEWLSQDDDLVNFRTGSWWKEIAKNYMLINRQLALFGKFVLIEEEKSITERITFYNGIVTTLKKLAPNIPALQYQSLTFLASSYDDMGNYALAEKNCLEAKAIIENLLGKEHPSYAMTLNNLGLLYKGMGDYAKAERCYLETKSIFEKTIGKEAPDYATSLDNLGLLYQDMGDYAKAERFILEAKAIREKVLGKEAPDYVTSANNLGTLYKDMGDFTKAERYILEAKTIWEKAFGKEHPDYAVLVNNLGDLYRGMGDYVKAESYYLEMKSIFEKVLGKEHPKYASALNNMGGLYVEMGDYTKAEFYYFEAKAIREKTLGKEHPHYATSLSNLGSLYNTTGDYTRAENYHLEAKAIKEKTFGKEHPSYAITLNNLGELYEVMGDYAKAERCHLEAKAILEKSLGKEHPDYASSLNNLGSLYLKMGDYANAERCYLETKYVYEMTIGKEHPDYATLVNNLGLLYQDMGDYAKAERFMLEAKVIREKKLGKEHSDYASSLNNLGEMYRSMGDYAKAERCHLEAKAIKEKTLGKEHPSNAVLLNNLGVLYEDMGDYAKAERSLLEAKTIEEKALGKEHPSYANTLGNLYTLYLGKKEYNKALEYKREQIKILTGLVNKNFSFQTEQQRNAYWNANSSSFELSYSLSFFNPIPLSNSLNYDNALFSKGLLLRTANAVRDAIYSSGNQSLITQFEELGRLRQQINALRQNGRDEAYIKSFEDKAEALDKSLTQSSAAFWELQADLAVNWQSVRKGLRQGEAAIEFINFQVYEKEWTGKTQYAALIVKPNSTSPAWIPLCDGDKLQEILNRAEETTRPDRQVRIIYNNNGLELFDAVWKPLEKELSGVTTIYYSPSGLLHKIAFNALPIDDSLDTRLTDKYNLNLVSSTREVVRLDRNPSKTTQITSAVLYGGLDYNANEAAMRKAAQSYQKDTNSSVVATVLPMELTRGEAMVDLPATKEEALNIQKYLNSKKIPNTLYQGSMGNEESFKQLDGKKTGLIHLATHGFFLPDVERKNDDMGQQQQQTRSLLRKSENPLLRSGLLFAGGNHAWTNKPVEGVESGILTAEKIAGMNLLGTRLVVMSACQTGLGDVKNGEGVFGLQRAFKLAGVETLVMSLWEVSDTVTSKLMSVFYQEWLISGKSKQEAFKEAQRQVRAEYSSPFYWAAFVMMD